MNSATMSFLWVFFLKRIIKRQRCLGMDNL